MSNVSYFCGILNKTGTCRHVVEKFPSTNFMKICSLDLKISTLTDGRIVTHGEAVRRVANSNILPRL